MKRWLVVLVCACAAFSTGIPPVTAAPPPKPKPATHGDPFSACQPNTDGFGGVAYPGTEPEVWLASNPARPRNLIGVAQQDRWSDGSAKGLVATVSFDNGKSWRDVPLPFSTCAAPYSSNVLENPYGGTGGIPLLYERATDPWVSIGPDGKAYTVSLSNNVSDNSNAIGAATSTDGGLTWGNVQAIVAEDPADPTFPFNDKEAVTADPAIAGSAYAVWERLVVVECPPGVSPLPGYNDCTVGPTLFSRTTDGGVTWSEPSEIVPTPVNDQTIANQIVVGPDGTLFNFYMYLTADGQFLVENVSSDDQGATWGSRQLVAAAQPVSVHDPISGAAIRTGDIIPSPAVDSNTGALYIVWQDRRANSVDPSQDGLYISRSTGGGAAGTWSSPAAVNTSADLAASTAAIQVLANGSVAVAYYRYPVSQPGGGVFSAVPVMRVTTGPGTTFGAVRAFGPAFNMLAMPYAGGYFAGDYMGLARDIAKPSTVHAYYTAATCNTTACAAVSGFDGFGNPQASGHPNPTDVYSAS